MDANLYEKELAEWMRSIPQTLCRPAHSFESF